MAEIDKRRREWLKLEGVLTVLERLRIEYPKDREMTRACYQVQMLCEKAEQRHFDAAIRLSRAAETVA